jgi:Domain of unknown function (DUF4398)
MPSMRRHTLSLLLAALLAGATFAGCAGAPLQEMSDARQAVRAAERAGAAQHAPEPLAEARQLVERARLGMQKGEYKEAREDAEKAREKAVEARRLAEAAAAPAPGA